VTQGCGNPGLEDGSPLGFNFTVHLGHVHLHVNYYDREFASPDVKSTLGIIL
jgi:hypothetical protein